MDIVGCPECPHAKVGDVKNLPFKDKEFGVVFVGHVLECIAGADMQKALDELYRVADKVYVAHLPDDTLSARYLSEVRSIIHAAPPTIYGVEYTDLISGERRLTKPTIRR